MSTFDGWVDRGEFHGLEEFMGFLRRWVEPYAEWQIEVEDVIDTERDEVLAVLHQRGRLRNSESSVEMHYGIVYTVQSSKVQRAQVYATSEQALETAGLSEWSVRERAGDRGRIRARGEHPHPDAYDFLRL